MHVHQLSYKHHKTAPYFFKDLSFKLHPGRMHALHGKNGTGKSILLGLLTRKTPPQSVIEGEIRGSENAVLVNQRFDQMMADQFSFEENLKFACMTRFPNPFTRLKAPRFLPDFLDRFNIDISQPVSKLSGGQRQILSLLMVLQQKRKILLLDEPTATLDEQNAALVFEFLKTLTLQDVTLLVVCHDQDLVNDFADGDHLYLSVNPHGLRTLKIDSSQARPAVPINK